MRILGFIVAVLALVNVAFSVTNVSSCGILDNVTDTYYTLNTNLMGGNIDASPFGGNTCIRVNASNIVFDCAGFSITNNESGVMHGVISVGGIFGGDPDFSNVTIKNCQIFNYTYGIRTDGADYGKVLNNTVLMDNNWTGILFNGNFGLIDGNFVQGGTSEGFQIGGSDNNVTNNTASGNLDGFYFNQCEDNLVSGNNASFNLESGFVFSNASSGHIISGNVAHDNPLAGFLLELENGNSLQNNTAFNNGAGFLVNASSGNSLAFNNAFNNGYGFYMENTSSDSVAFNNASANAGPGFFFINSSTSNVVFNNAHDNPPGGIVFVNSSGNNVAFNFANGSEAGIVFVLNSSGNNIPFNNVASNGLVGLGVIADSNDNTLVFNTASVNGLAGIAVIGSSGNTLSINTVSNSATAGIALLETFESFSAPVTNNNVSNNIVFDNGVVGIVLNGSDSNLLSYNDVFGNGIGVALINGADFNNLTSGNAFYSNLGQGLVINESNNTLVSDIRLYNNSPDFSAVGTGMSMSLLGVIFDSPSGNLTNYTNLSITDVVASEYSIDHSDQPAPLPPETAPLAGKFVNITEITPNASIDSISWHYLDSELTGVNEQGLRLWEYDGTWVLHGFTPDQPTNTLTATNLSDFSVFALLQTTPTSSGGDEGAGGSGGTPALAIAFNSSGNLVTVTSGGDPVPGATVRVNGSIVGTTDANGQITFSGCGGTAFLSAIKEGYHFAELDASLAACGGCVTNNDCPATLQCASGVCGPVACACGTVSNHQCVAFACCSDADCALGQSCVDHSCQDSNQCTSDSQCADTQFCDVPAGASGGSCKDVQAGACGQVINHKFVPYGYECGSEPGCPSCPSGQNCAAHKCVAAASDLSCPSTGVVGGSAGCTATNCANCDYEVTDPSGKKSTGKTDASGRLNVPLGIEGTYKVTLLKDGQPVKTMEVKSLPKTPAEGGEKPPTQGGSDLILPLLLVLVLILIGGVLYWRSRGQKK